MQELSLSHFFQISTCLSKTSSLLCSQGSSPDHRSFSGTRYICSYTLLLACLQASKSCLCYGDSSHGPNERYLVNPGMTPMCTFVPRQLTRDQMTSLFPESWITKYEALHQTVKPIQTNNPFYMRKENDEVETKFGCIKIIYF